MALFGLLSLWQLVLIAICVPVVYRIFIAAKDPLHDVPGPLLARFTRLWFLKAILNRDFEKTHIALHKKYGELWAYRLTVADALRPYCSSSTRHVYLRRSRSDINHIWHHADFPEGQVL